MPYDYKEIKPSLFTEASQRLFLEVRDKVHRILSEMGEVRMGFIMRGLTGDSWKMMACVDRLVELDEIVEISHRRCTAQDRIFIKKK